MHRQKPPSPLLLPSEAPQKSPRSHPKKLPQHRQIRQLFLHLPPCPSFPKHCFLLCQQSPLSLPFPVPASQIRQTLPRQLPYLSLPLPIPAQQTGQAPPQLPLLPKLRQKNHSGHQKLPLSRRLPPSPRKPAMQELHFRYPEPADPDPGQASLPLLTAAPGHPWHWPVPVSQSADLQLLRKIPYF